MADLLELYFWCQFGNLKGHAIYILKIFIAIYTFLLKLL